MEEIYVKNFFSKEGLYWFLEHMISNYTSFPPLGLVLVMTVAVGFCEESGLIEAILSTRNKHIPTLFIPYIVAFIGILGNLASDTSAIVIPPLGGLLFYSAGLHPVAGMICGYAASNSGFSANIMISGTDALLQGITQNVVNNFLGEGVLSVDVTCNWYFMVASTFMGTLVIGFLFNHFINKRFGSYTPPEGFEISKGREIAPREKTALRWAYISILVFLLIIVCSTIWGPLGIIVGKEDSGARGFVGSYLLKNLIPILVFFFSIPGIVFGLASRRFESFSDIYKTMVKVMGKMSGYLVFCFFTAQFQKLFSWTNLDQLLAINGANLLNSSNFTGYGLIISFILFSSFINIFISSASAKWAIFAPVFIPMLMMAGNYHPALTQLLYRIGDSSTNCFTPVMPYLWVTLKAGQDMFDPKLRLGSLVSNLLPIGIVMLIVWTISLVIWIMLGLPIGPGVTTFL
jgi:aminobenzoyl-glutamate transport protein